MATRRWTCGKHRGTLAPERLRMDDVRRYCWPCSLERGRLVERSCLGVELRRRVKGARRRSRAQEAADRKREIRAVVTRAKKLKTWKREVGRVAASRVKLEQIAFTFGGKAPPRAVVFQPHGAPGHMAWMIHVPADAAPWRIGLTVLGLLANAAAVASELSEHARNAVLIQAAGEMWPDLEPHVQKMLVVYRCGAHTRAAAADVIRTEYLIHNPAEE